jgi:hypothetical protein
MTEITLAMTEIALAMTKGRDRHVPRDDRRFLAMTEISPAKQSLFSGCVIASAARQSFFCLFA